MRHAAQITKAANLAANEIVRPIVYNFIQTVLVAVQERPLTCLVR